MTNRYTAFERTVDSLIADTRWRANLGATDKNQIASPTWLKERHTLRLKAGRRAGYTAYIKKHATADDIIVVPLVRNRKQQYARHPATVLTADEVKTFALGKRVIGTVYVDDPTHVFRRIGSTRLYWHLHSASVLPLFVLLGA